MKYKYRWFYAVLITVAVTALGYLYELKSVWSEVRAAREDERQARLRFDKASQQATQAVARDAALQQKSQAESLSDLLALVQQSGLTLQSIRFAMPQEWSVMGVDMLHLVVKGSFNGMAAFVDLMTSQSTPGLMTDFSLKVLAQDQLTVEMDVLTLKTSLKKSLVPVDEVQSWEMQSPFCLSAHAASVSAEDAVQRVQSTSLNQIKMTGYLRQADRSRALVLLPNNAVVEVGLGDVIGKERGTVTSIAHDSLQARLPDNKQILLKM